MKIAITGGIGSGKSYICQILRNHFDIDVYDCDSAAKRLIRTSPMIREGLTSLIGNDVYIGNNLNKKLMSEYLLQSEDNAKAIGNIVHGAVADDFIHSNKQWMECAILYESGFDKLVDKVIAVTAPLQIRIDRVMSRDNISSQQVEMWMSRQISQEEIINAADYEIINDGSLDIDRQITEIFNKINQ